MASNVTFNGVTYSIPAEGDTGWGPDLTAYFISIASNAFQKTGGAFTLTAEADFGANFGLKTVYIKSKATNPASAGFLRLGSAQSVSWRNNANNADLALTTDASDNLLYNSKTVLFSGLGLIVNADVSNSAAIAYSKLNLTGAILNADLAGSIDATKIADGSVSNAEFQYINTLSSNAQTQLDAKLNASFGIVNNVLSWTDRGTTPSTPSAGFKNTYSKSSGMFYLNSSGNEYQFANLSEAQNLTNKTLDNSNTLTVRDDRFTMQDNSDSTKQVVFQLSGITTGTTRTITVADANIEIGKLPTIQKFTSGSGTYTTPAGVRYIQVEMVGGGGGGGGSGTAGSPTAGGAGGDTTFGSTIVVANGGGGGGTAASGDGGTGGTASLSGATGINLTGGQGGQRSAAIAGVVSSGPLGGSSAFGGAGGSSSGTGAGQAGAPNTGGGGGGAYSVSGQASSSGGGGGGYAKAIITSPSASYAYAVGAGGTAGAAGTSGFAGGAGGSGLIVVTEYYN